MRSAVVLVLVLLFGGSSLVTSVVAQEGGDAEPLYCVKEGGMTEIPKDCIVVERIEDVPKGATWIPSHGGADDPEEIRRFWCLDYSGDLPPVSAVPAKCLRFFAAEYGGDYARAIAPRPESAEPAMLRIERAEPPKTLLDLPALTIEGDDDRVLMDLPAMDLPAQW